MTAGISIFAEVTEDDAVAANAKGKKVELNPYVPRPSKPYVLMTDDELIAGAGGYLSFDIEVYKNYLCICFKCLYTGKVIIFEQDNEVKRFAPAKLYWVMHNYTTFGFNSIKFDIPLLWWIHSGRDCESVWNLVEELIIHNLRPSEVAAYLGYNIPETAHIDLIEVCPVSGSLKAYGARLHCERLQDLPYAPGSMLYDDQKQITLEYCINDLDINILIFNALLEQLKLRDELSTLYRQNLMSKSDAQIAETVISAEIGRVTGHRPQRPEVEPGRVFRYKVPEWMQFVTPMMQGVLATVAGADYVVQSNGTVDIPDDIKKLKIAINNSVYRMGNGGLHSSEQSVCHVADDEVSLIDRDVASYYPYIVLNLGLFPEHLGTSFLVVYRTIVERRIAAKRAKQSAIADSLKIVINGAFGKLGSPYSILYAPDLMIQVTMTGQLSLLMLIERLELAGIPIISANTDGIVQKCPKHLEAKSLEVIAEWEKLTGFETEETRYKGVYSRDVNAYIAVKEDNTCKGKNAYFDPWSGGKKAAIFRFNKNPWLTICIEAVNDLLTKGTSIEDTINGCEDVKKFVAVRVVQGGGHKAGEYLGKVCRWYYAIGEKGTINYVKNNNTVSLSKGARPLMDLPDKVPADLDRAYYIQAAKDMLIDLGHTKAPGEVNLFGV